ncbi:hypothetical protein KBD45_03300 [Candidatus Dojkabacteria bacterium]|nr:hypothetical protein [Candidatus Dojkabacteria bacterium]
MKLINWNISIKIDNSKEVAKFLSEQNADLVNLQEVIRHFEASVFKQYQSKQIIDPLVKGKYLDNFFAPAFCSKCFYESDEITPHRDFGGLMEQGLDFYSKYKILSADNLFYFKTYNYSKSPDQWKAYDQARSLGKYIVEVNGKKLQIINIHGIWNTNNEGNQKTLAQSEFIINIVNKSNLPTIISGDFNLHPDTESISILNKNFRNLIAEYSIKRTRPDFKDTIDSGNNVVDYVFVNDQVKVNDFKVIETEISDHFPLLLNFEILTI